MFSSINSNHFDSISITKTEKFQMEMEMQKRSTNKFNSDYQKSNDKTKQKKFSNGSNEQKNEEISTVVDRIFVG